jgi:predicted P-loop ATPase
VICFLHALGRRHGTGKSAAFKVLGGASFFDSLKSLDQNKDTLMQLRGKWILEIPEMSAMNPDEVSDNKSFIESLDG